MSEVVQILKGAGAILEGHFIGVSGRHLPVYINKDAWVPHTALASRVGELFAEAHKNRNVEVVVGAAIGGIVLSQWTAYHLSRITGTEALSVFTEKTPDGNQVFKRGYDKLVAGKRVLALDDVLTTGGSLKKVIDSCKAAGAEVVCATAMLNKDPDHITDTTFGLPFAALATFPVPSYGEEEVPDSLKAVPINTTVGHGAQYLKEHGE